MTDNVSYYEENLLHFNNALKLLCETKEYIYNTLIWLTKERNAIERIIKSLYGYKVMIEYELSFKEKSND
mgnify:CR=1 FL=1